MADLQFAGEFELNTIEIIASSGQSIDNITPLEINIFESIFSNALTGNISIADTNNLIELMPLIGQEQLILKMTTPSLEGENTTIDFTKNAFSIYNISVNSEMSSGSSVYVLEFCSPELLINNRVRISKAFTDTPSTIVENVLTNHINTTKNIETETTSGIKNIVVPNQRPFDFLKCLIQDSKSTKDSPHYLFYETTRGYNFRTLQNLYEKVAVGVFNNSESNIDEKVGNTLGIQEAYDRMINFDVKPPNNALNDSRAGMFGSKIISHNIFTKSYNVKTYGYFSDFDKHKRIDEKNNPKYNDNLGNWSNSRIYVHPTSASGSNLNAQYRDENNSNNSIVANQISETLLQRKSRMYELTFSKTIAITIHGTTNIAAGDIVELNYTAPGRNHGDGTLDKSISGRYLITKLRHTFSPVTNQHQIDMVVSRDSLPSELPFSINVAEVKKEGKSQILDITT
tara:strand:+ start:597 stop:1964 length:1368 start_codon:yes stop_codon:yes gene_type:complete